MDKSKLIKWLIISPFLIVFLYCIVIVGVPFLVILAESIKTSSLYISECFFYENNLVLVMEKQNVREYLVSDAYIKYLSKPISLTFAYPKDLTIEEEWYDKKNSKQIITLKLNDLSKDKVYNGIEEIYDAEYILQTLYVNEEAELIIYLFGGHIRANIYIGEDYIDIIDQGYGLRK